MPTINIYYSSEDVAPQLEELIDGLKAFAADKLSGKDIKLQTDEVSVRLMKTTGQGMLAAVELEITAHAFGERIIKQDQICLDVRQFVKEMLDVDEVRVWLLLPQLGHSWE